MRNKRPTESSTGDSLSCQQPGWFMTINIKEFLALKTVQLYQISSEKIEHNILWVLRVGAVSQNQAMPNANVTAGAAVL